MDCGLPDSPMLLLLLLLLLLLHPAAIVAKAARRQKHRSTIGVRGAAAVVAPIKMRSV
jgi:hypothetical protein